MRAHGILILEVVEMAVKVGWEAIYREVCTDCGASRKGHVRKEITIISDLSDREILMSLQRIIPSMASSDIASVKCPYCGAPNLVAGPNVRNPHRWDGDPVGSFWRGCGEKASTCIACGRDFHVDVDR